MLSFYNTGELLKTSASRQLEIVKYLSVQSSGKSGNLDSIYIKLLE